MAAPPALETRALSKRYGSVLAVDGLSLTVAPGQVFGFLGPNGAGKSTTMRMLLGLVRPVRGQAWIFGRPCGSVAARRRGLVGAQVEDPAFYGYLSAYQNLALLGCLSGGVSAAEIDRVLELVGLRGARRRKVAAYSHGMRQRLGLAQALLPLPRLLILDEPTSGLDPQGRVEVRELLMRLSTEHGVTIFLSSHLLEEVEKLCTHLAFLSHGRLLAAGPTDELLSTSTVRVELRAQPLETASAVLTTHPQVSGLVRELEALTFACPRQALPSLNASLVAAGVAVYSLAPHPESLEDLYLRLMGGEGDV